MRIALPLVLVLAAGCGSDGGTNHPDVDAAVTPTPDAFMPAGYTKLIGRSWSIGPNALDEYQCARITIPQDMYITNIIAQAPTGTHHTVLSIADNSRTMGPDGNQDNCTVGTLGMQMLYASGVGTSPLDFPAGVGVRVSAGQQIHLNLHLFNAGDEPLSGESGIWVKAQTTPPAQIAEMVFAGKFALILQPTNQPTDIVGGCIEPTGYSLFAVWPHMHQLARHQKVEHIRNATTTVLHDAPYNFAEQEYYLKNPIFEVQSGDEIKVTCTYVNNTGTTVTWGDGSNQEMCFAGMYRYPALNQGLTQCSDAQF